MLMLSDNRISGHVSGKPVHGRTLPPVIEHGLPRGVFELQLPVSDPVFGLVMMALRRAGGAGVKADIIIKHAPDSARLIEWKHPDPGSAQFPKMSPGPGSAQFPKMSQKPGGAQFPKMSPGPDSAQFPKMTGAAHEGIKRAAAAPGNPDAFVVGQRAIPGRYCLVVVEGFSDLVAALKAGGPALLTVR